MLPQPRIIENPPLFLEGWPESGERKSGGVVGSLSPYSSSGYVSPSVICIKWRKQLGYTAN
jgi:hypothetical protein